MPDGVLNHESELIMDHGFAVDINKRCRSTTKKAQQCTLPVVVGIELCALHAGLAKAKGKPGWGDAKALEAYKRSLTPAGAAARSPAPAAGGRR